MKPLTLKGKIYEPNFNDIKLFCPFCHKKFAKEDSPKTWGA